MPNTSSNTALNPIFIIGAPRSGTNMLRDILSEFNDLETWPCDEINYIWRHHNIHMSHDVFTEEQVSNKVRQYLRNTFLKFQEQHQCKYVLEKTCANSLRIPFIHKIFPEAKYIFIYRDGPDAIGSAKLRWTANLDINYILKKVKFVPATDLPFYALRYIYHRVFKLFSKEKRLASWGPTLPNMQTLLKKYSLIEICSIQWKTCFQKAKNDLGQIDNKQQIHISYENFVNNPQEQLKNILTFLDIKPDQNSINEHVKNVSNKSIGKGIQQLTNDEKAQVEQILNKATNHDFISN